MLGICCGRGRKSLLLNYSNKNNCFFLSDFSRRCMNQYRLFKLLTILFICILFNGVQTQKQYIHSNSGQYYDTQLAFYTAMYQVLRSQRPT
jgi:hypothetical protein